MGSSSSTSNLSTTDASTTDNKIAADGDARVLRNEGGDLIVNETAGVAVDLTEIMADTFGNFSTNIFDFADNAGDDASALSMSALDFAQQTAAQGQATTQQALDTVGRGFAQALEESREDDTQIASQLITYGIPAIAIFMIWKML